MEQQGETIVVALDIAKAFGKVWHENLLLKMKAFGVDETTLNWTRNFLDQRVIRFVVDGFTLEPHIITGRVPLHQRSFGNYK